MAKKKSINNKHPWVFSGAIDKINSSPQSGDVVEIYDHKNRFLALGVFSPKSQIRVRILTWAENEEINPQFWYKRINQALAGRTSLRCANDTTAYRLIHAESDGLPGLIVDQYGPWLVVQFLAVAADHFRETIITTLTQLINPQGIFERSDSYTRKLEGLAIKNDLVCGDMPPDLVEIKENGFRFLTDIKQGQKTGYYLDQRPNRQQLAPYLTDKYVLNVFSFSGSFSVYAAAKQAKHITNIDTSAEAHHLARQNMRLNSFDDRDDSYVTGDAFEVLRSYRDQGQSFDVIILDPPKFARNVHQIKSASRGYKDINLLALKLLNPGGILASFSCSGNINESLFQKIIFGAAVDAQRDVQIIERLHQGTDHPILVTFPESAYLKGFICKVW